MNLTETQLSHRAYPNQNLLRELIIRRTVGDHEAEFALQCIKLGPNYYGPERLGHTDVYRVEIDPSQPLIKTAQQRKWTIQNGINTWGAGGYFPVLIFNDGSRWVASLYRDAGAPSWPDHYTTPSGLSHLLIGNIPEAVEITSNRELKEELVFLNRQNLHRIRYDSERKSFAFLNECFIPRKTIDDEKTLVQVYKNGKLVEESRPFTVGWGTEKDTVTTVVHACTLYPEMTIPGRQNLLLLNGEVVKKEDIVSIFSRDVALLSLDDFREKKSMVEIVHYKAIFDEDKISVSESERPHDDIKMTEPLAAAIRKVKGMREQEYNLFFS
jgi:hypothetical protein